MLTKIENGIEVECSPEEEALIRSEWAENDKKALAERSFLEAKESLRIKYGDIYEAFDKLLKHLKIDPSELKK